MKKLLFFILPALLCACNNNEPDSKQVLQEIISPIDCISSKGWSWNNGVATASYAYYPEDKDKNVMTFNAAATGELTFAYEGYSGWVAVQIDNNEVFKESFYTSQSKKFSLYVSKGQKIAIMGSDCTIQDIRIVGQADNTQPDTPDNPTWDF